MNGSKKPALLGAGNLPFIFPQAGTNVQVQGSGTGYICSYGSWAGDTLLNIYGKILPPGTFPGANPPAGSVQGTVVSSPSYFWYFKGSQSIPGALCSSGGAANTLGLWTYFRNDAAFTSQGIQFQGICAAQTNCGPVGFQGGQELELVDTAPLQWSVRIESLMSNEEGVLNGEWTLTLRRGPGFQCLWDNGGDGQAGLRVELRYTTMPVVAWELCFQHGSREWRYATPVNDWNWLGKNDMQAVEERSDAPGTIQLVPV